MRRRMPTGAADIGGTTGLVRQRPDEDHIHPASFCRIQRYVVWPSGPGINPLRPSP